MTDRTAATACRPDPFGRGRSGWKARSGDASAGGRTAATLCRVVASAKRHGLDPFVYLRDAPTKLGHTPVRQPDQFLPEQWKQQQLQQIARG